MRRPKSPLDKTRESEQHAKRGFYRGRASPNKKDRVLAREVASMASETAIHKALGGKGKKSPTHTHGVHYERAANGGYVAHVHKHHGKGPHSEGHSHSEEHVLPDKEAMLEHMDEHMGDQPAAGEMAPPQEPEEAGGGGGPAAAPQADAGAGPGPQA